MQEAAQPRRPVRSRCGQRERRHSTPAGHALPTASGLAL